MSIRNFKTKDADQARRYVTNTMWPDSRLVQSDDTSVVIMIDTSKKGRRWGLSEDGETWEHSFVPYEHP